MTNRITRTDLNGAIDRLNRLTNSPMTYSDGKHPITINIGHYHLDRTYGGNQLVRTVNDGGGVSNVLRTGHVSARECYDGIHAYIAGIEVGKGGV